MTTEQTIRNPRWWVALPFILFVGLPLAVCSLALSLTTGLFRMIERILTEVSDSYETMGHRIVDPILHWVRDGAKKSRVAERAKDSP